MLTIAAGLALGLSIALGTLWAKFGHLHQPASFVANLAIALGVWLAVAGIGWLAADRFDRVLAREWIDVLSWINALDDYQWQPLAIPDAGPWGQLRYALNQMAKRLAAAQSQRDLFLASVAHELKTPLTVLRANLEGLAAGELAETPERWTALHREVQRLTRLVNDLLLIETMRTPVSSIQPRRYWLSEQVHEMLMKFSPLAGVREIVCAGNIDAVEIVADRERMEQVLSNLMDNALRHTPPGGRIDVTLRDLPDRVECCVEDSGAGIRPGLESQVTQPFVRDPRSPGAGLGLAVALSLLQAQGGTLLVGRSQLGGARVCLTLPRAR